MVHSPPLTAAKILKALGGPTALAQRDSLDAHRSAIANWYKHGIPGRYWPALARIAALKPETSHITIDELERHVAPTQSDATSSSQEAA